MRGPGVVDEVDVVVAPDDLAGMGVDGGDPDADRLGGVDPHLPDEAVVHRGLALRNRQDQKGGLFFHRVGRPLEGREVTRRDVLGHLGRNGRIRIDPDIGVIVRPEDEEPPLVREGERHPGFEDVEPVIDLLEANGCLAEAGRSRFDPQSLRVGAEDLRIGAHHIESRRHELFGRAEGPRRLDAAPIDVVGGAGLRVPGVDLPLPTVDGGELPHRRLLGQRDGGRVVAGEVEFPERNRGIGLPLGGEEGPRLTRESGEGREDQQDRESGNAKGSNVWGHAWLLFGMEAQAARRGEGQGRPPLGAVGREGRQIRLLQNSCDYSAVSGHRREEVFPEEVLRSHRSLSHRDVSLPGPLLRSLTGSPKLAGEKLLK